MTAHRVVILRCDGNGAVNSCQREYVGAYGMNLTDVRAWAEQSGWTCLARRRHPLDLCPENHASVGPAA
jgi:hypothetical protein